MGLGNGNPTNGDKGSNFNYELKVLQALEAIANTLDGGGSSVDPTLNPGPLFSSGDFEYKPSSISFDDVNVTVNSAYGTYTKVGNIVSATIVIFVTGLTNLGGTINFPAPIDVIGDLSLVPTSVTGTMNVELKNIDYNVHQLKVLYPSAFDVVYSFSPTIVSDNTFIIQITYPYNTNLILASTAPIIL